MTWLSDSTELVPGGWLSSAYAGHGILGADVPTSGLHGASAIYNDLVDMPADLTVELRLYLELVPPGLTSFAMGEDGAITAEAPVAGTYVGTGRLYAAGVDRGTAAITLIFGNVVTAGLQEAVAVVDGLATQCLCNVTVAELLGAADGWEGAGPRVLAARRQAAQNLATERRPSNLAGP